MQHELSDLFLHITPSGAHIAAQVNEVLHCGCCAQADEILIETLPEWETTENTFIFVSLFSCVKRELNEEIVVCTPETPVRRFSCGCPTWFNTLEKEHTFLPLWS